MAESTAYKVRLSNGTEYGPAGMDVLVRWAQEGRIPMDAAILPCEGGPARPVVEVPELARLVQAPPVVQTGVVTTPPDDSAISTIIPYRNPPALVGYYLAVFSLIPVFGILLGVPAFVLGIIGLRKRLGNPRVRGAVHAWIAIIGGALTTILWLGLLATVMVGVAVTRP